jgi:CRP/FNR family transcriptional regulator, polysaccharide utilization system transcription regulator
VSSEFLRVRLTREMEDNLREFMTPCEFLKGSTLFKRGTPPAGVYLIETGRVRLLLPTDEDKNQLLEEVGAGTLLGLSDSMAGEHYRATAEAEEPTVASFIGREAFLGVLSRHQDFCMHVIHLLSENLHGLYHKFRSVSAHPGRPRRRSLNERLS